MNNKTFNQRVLEIVKQIPSGYVMNYGQIARLAGNPLASRAVGYALHKFDLTPWHRVVFKDGSLPCLGLTSNTQRQLLEKEGIEFLDNGKVDIKKHLYDAAEIEAKLVGW